MKIHKQKGLTLIGFVIVLAFALFIAFIGMKIGPIYVDNFAVESAMNEVAGDKGAARKSPYDIRLKFFTLMNLNAIDHVRESNVKLIRSTGVRMQVKYEVREPIMGNLDIVVRFDKTVRLSD
jgi:hypothetical protein